MGRGAAIDAVLMPGGVLARYKLVVEGTNLAAVLGISGVEGTRSWSNHILEVKAVLGIEAARAKIMEQITFTMGQHGMAIDPRHIMLLAETMTYKVRLWLLASGPGPALYPRRTIGAANPPCVPCRGIGAS